MKITASLQPTLATEPIPPLPELTTDPLAGVGGYRVQTDVKAAGCSDGYIKDAAGRCVPNINY